MATPKELNEGKKRHDPDYLVSFPLIIKAEHYDTFVNSLPRTQSANNAIVQLVIDANIENK